MKLSELMNYVIYKGKNNLVSLSEEIEHINNYIDLEILRFGHKLDAKLSIIGDIQNKSLPPLILMPFVENSFKHGIHYRFGKIPIHISIEVNGSRLQFTTKNPKGAVEPLSLKNKEISGIGIQNTKRRLELLYGQNFSLEVEDLSEYFIVTLKFDLHEN